MPILRETRAISSRPPRNLASSGGKFIPLILSAALCSAATIYDSGVVALPVSSPVETGRLARNGVVSDWSAPKDFPGAIINPPVSFHYETFVLTSILYPYIQISIDDLNGTAQTFASAYLNSYTPNNLAPNYGLDTNYLGDAGGSGNFGGNPRAFQVVAPAGNTLVLVVNDSSITGAGIGQPFRLIVEGFSDTNFNDAPEPATFGFIAAGIGAGALLLWKRKLVR